jgi:hypothetical protein
MRKGKVTMVSNYFGNPRDGEPGLIPIGKGICTVIPNRQQTSFRTAVVRIPLLGGSSNYPAKNGFLTTAVRNNGKVTHPADNGITCTYKHGKNNDN